MLCEIALDLAHAAGGPLLDPRLGEVVLDAMQDAAYLHVAIFDRAPDGRMIFYPDPYGWDEELLQKVAGGSGHA